MFGQQFKSVVPLNKKFYNRKLHSSQSSRYGVVPVVGSDGNHFNTSNVYGYGSATPITN